MERGHRVLDDTTYECLVVRNVWKLFRCPPHFLLFVRLSGLIGVSQVSKWVKNLPVVKEIWVQSQGQEDPLEKRMATHSSVLAWKIPWTEEPGRLQYMGSQRVRHGWSDWACMHAGLIILKSQKGNRPGEDMPFTRGHRDDGLALDFLQFSCSVMSDSLWPCELQHAGLPCPSPTLGACSNSCPLSQWCHPTISSCVVPFSSCLQSCPTSGSFPVSQFFALGGQNIRVSASVLPMNIQDWFPLGLTGLISLQSKGLSRVFSNTTVQKHQFFGA